MKVHTRIFGRTPPLFSRDRDGPIDRSKWTAWEKCSDHVTTTAVMTALNVKATEAVPTIVDIAGNE